MSQEELRITPRALQLYLELREFPILSDEIRQRMRSELIRRGVIREDQFEDEVRENAVSSQRRERLFDPEKDESAEVWALRLSRVRDTLTDFYFAHNLPRCLFREIIANVLNERAEHERILTFNPETAPWHLLFAKGEEFENAPEERRRQTEHHLKEIVVVLTKRMLSDQLAFVGLARKHFKICDLKDISARSIGTGKIGGKAAGMHLAWRVLQEREKDDPIEVGPRVKVPESWFIASDAYYEFIETNDLFSFLNQKYKDLDQIRAEYQVQREYFETTARLPQKVIRRLSEILDEVGTSPLIARSSSLLEDNFGTAFAGKYETHFAANQGDRDQRLRQLCQAVLKVYASGLNPNALAYRKQMGLIDYDERMGVLIQKVEGTPYRGHFFPQMAGVGFSHNPYRWTTQIDRKGGFLRIVWGLGTRAVDRVGGDYPRMVALSNPTLRPERSARDIQRCSQHYIDTIDLASNELVTVPVNDLIRSDTPALKFMASIAEDGDLLPIHLDDPRIAPDRYVLTFDRLLRSERFVMIMRTILKKLERAYGWPVDIEYTVEVIPGLDPDYKITLLQCRPQASREEGQTVTVPRNIPSERVVFASSGTVLSGKVSNIRYVVYVDPEHYSHVQTMRERNQMARVIGRLNQKLAGNAFILVGPGRWGSSNPELGVPVSYADIFHVDALVEVPLAIRDEEPEASYGTHFFQDLIESKIYPVAVYPGKKQDLFNFGFFRNAPNALLNFLPDETAMAEYVKLINIPEYQQGRMLELVMESGDREAMMAYLCDPSV